MPDHLTIDSIRIRPVVVPMPRPIRTAVGEIPSAPLVLIDVSTTEGVTGRAYVFAYKPLAIRPLVEMLQALAGLIAGKAVVPVERMRELDIALKLLGRQGLAGMAMSGLDMALWDVLARARGMALCELLGGSANPLPAYDSFGLVDPKRDRKALEKSVTVGFRAIKIKVGGGSLADDVGMVGGVREILGPEVRLMIDYNQSLNPVEAVRRAERLFEFDIDWIEEPVAADDLTGHARVREKSPIPVQTGENWWFPAGMATALALDACDLAMPDVSRIGGVSGWLEAAGMASAASVPMSSHALLEVSAHLLAVTPTAHWLEYLDKARVLLVEPPLLQDGCVTPKGPGIGMDWDEKAIARYAA